MGQRALASRGKVFVGAESVLARSHLENANRHAENTEVHVKSN